MCDDGFAELAVLKKRLESLGVKIKANSCEERIDTRVRPRCNSVRCVHRMCSVVNNVYSEQDSGNTKSDVNGVLARCTRIEACLKTCTDIPGNCPSSSADTPVPDANHGHVGRSE